jgi:hypothetical protein
VCPDGHAPKPGLSHSADWPLLPATDESTVVHRISNRDFRISARRSIGSGMGMAIKVVARMRLSAD